ncbi:MAG: hypothetical protein V1484_02110 [bacterium]
MDNIIDLLQIKIEQAKAQLPEDTQNAISAVDWKAVILGMRGKRGYSFEQLGDLEIETELLLCGLLNPENYSKELEKRMRLSKTEVNDLVKEMNSLVFTKIKENLIKNIERKKIFAEQTPVNEIIPASPASGSEKLESMPPPPILAQKLSDSFQVPIVKTEHTLENITKSPNTDSGIVKSPGIDPYRETPD